MVENEETRLRAEDLLHSKEAGRVRRMMRIISDHMVKNGTTLKDEYELIKKKESTLGRNYRDFIVEYFFTETPDNDIKNLVK